MNFIEYYSNDKVQEALLKSAQGREIGVKFKNGFGKRPDILQYKNDILEFVKSGATSFHISEERWKDPLSLRSGMSIRELNELRHGWDLILDIDCKFFEYSKITAFLLIEALKFHGVQNIGLKFSGNRSFHIVVPFEAFPEIVNNIPVKDLFPEGTRVIAEYLKQMIKEELKKAILETSDKEELTKLSENGEFDPYSLIEIDSVAISSRHMIRAPYSINEKSMLVSVPLDICELKNFGISDAKPENIKFDKDFIPKAKKGGASNLIIQAFDWDMKNKKEKVEINSKRVFEIPQIAIKETYFPSCITEILKGVKKDGRKRSVFILITFLKNMGWKNEDIEKRLLGWNDKNYEPLSKGYILSQISWHKRQRRNILPPNCDNKAYYQDIGIKCTCKNIKNPVNYVFRKIKRK